jgi:hypothetical protein
MDEETMGAAYAIAAYHLQIQSLAHLVVNGALSMEDAATAFEKAAKNAETTPLASGEACAAASKILSDAIASMRKPH